MKKVLKVLLGIIEIIVVVFAITITTLMLSKNQFGYTQIGDKILVNVTKDNEDYLTQFKKGDLIIIEKEDYEKVNNGDELYYLTTEAKEYIINKGYVSNKTGNKKTAIYTFDEDNAIASERVLGQYDKSYGNLGGVLNTLESRWGFLLGVILPIMVIFIYQVYN